MLFLVLICLVLADKPAIKNLFDTAVSHAALTHCPFADMKGLHKMCELKAPTTSLGPLPVTLGTGWDPVKAEIKIPLFNYSFRQNKQYVFNGRSKWIVPDQINMIAKVPSNRTTTTLYSNVDQYLAQMNPNRSNVSSGNLALPIDLIPDFFHWFQNGATNIVTVSQIVNLFDMELNGEPVLSPYFVRMIESLPVEFDAETYAMFIDYVGTEVVVAAKVGGTAHQTVMTKSCFGGIDLTNQAALYMEKTFEPEKYSHVSFSAGFEQYSRASVIDVYGGDPKIVDQAKWVDRVATMSDYPVLTDVVVKPITSFIRNTTIRSNVQKAIDAYYAKGNANLQAYREAYLNSMRGPKTVTFISLLNPPNLVIESSSVILNSGESRVVGKTPYTDKYRPMTFFEAFGCARTSDSTIRAYVDGAHVSYVNSILQWMGSFVTITAGTGSDISYGCSTASYNFKLPGWNWLGYLPGSSVNIMGHCCMDCIPSLSGSALVGCTCPPF